MNNKGYTTLSIAFMTMAMTLVLIGLLGNSSRRQTLMLESLEEDLELGQGINKVNALERVYARFYKNISYVGDPNLSDREYHMEFNDLDKKYKIENEEIHLKEIVKEDTYYRNGSVFLDFEIDNATDIKIMVDFRNESIKDFIYEEPYEIDSYFPYEVELLYQDDNGKIHSCDINNKVDFEYRIEKNYYIPSEETYNTRTDETFYGKYRVEVRPSRIMDEYYGGADIDIKVSFRELDRTVELRDEQGKSYIVKMENNKYSGKTKGDQSKQVYFLD